MIDRLSDDEHQRTDETSTATSPLLSESTPLPSQVETIVASEDDNAPDDAPWRPDNTPEASACGTTSGSVPNQPKQRMVHLLKEQRPAKILVCLKQPSIPLKSVPLRH